ncbi:hypothetical protein [Streptomyces yaizuensis]|uniref:Uncharacterized protein n=1 Tax=Streptomyces yaizuensis TaxID=2989713 RepID=A0ABQ5PAC5_9ACTN|nr:hypothetical protein [Streptomyces sp. YSPA8]GLF99171.1 hypothetical protein SYYSPA8_32760 [Streptomyces sp. YSPA8]
MSDTLPIAEARARLGSLVRRASQARERGHGRAARRGAGATRAGWGFLTYAITWDEAAVDAAGRVG